MTDKPKRPPLFRLLFLAFVHAVYLGWAALAAVFAPRYRPVVRFQARYLRDVLRAAARGESITHPDHRP